MVTIIIFMAMSFIEPPGAVSAGAPPVWGFALDGHPVTQGKLKDLASGTGLTPGIVVFFLQWPSPGDAASGAFPTESLEAIAGAGALPCITWEPMYVKDGRETVIPYSHVLDGRYDSYITAFAEKARSWNKPLLIRFAHEMNLRRYHWGTSEKEYGPRSPEIYRKLYRYVVDLFRRSGAANALWAFCPNAEAIPNTSIDPSASWNTMSRYYPGDGYVDVLGVDGYNWGTTRKKEIHGWESRWMTFGEIFRAPLSELRTLSPARSGKPLVVFETATVDAGGDKAGWIRDALKASADLGVDGIVWFQSDKEADWRIESGCDRSCLSGVQRRTSPRRTVIDRILREKVR